MICLDFAWGRRKQNLEMRMKYGRVFEDMDINKDGGLSQAEILK